MGVVPGPETGRTWGDGSGEGCVGVLGADSVAPAEGGNGIVFLRTFLGATSRITVLLSGDLQVLVDVPSTHAAAMTPGASVAVGIPSDPVLVVATEG